MIGTQIVKIMIQGLVICAGTVDIIYFQKKFCCDRKNLFVLFLMINSGFLILGNVFFGKLNVGVVMMIYVSRFYSTFQNCRGNSLMMWCASQNEYKPTCCV